MAKEPFYDPQMWKWHDIYLTNMSYSRVVTRSQTRFNRIKINDDDIEFFCDKERYEPPNLPHLIFKMKDGVYGAIPRTIITRSTSSKLGISHGLTKTIESYKTFFPMTHQDHLTHDPLAKDVPKQTIDYNGAFNQIKSEPEQMNVDQLPRLEELEEKPNASNGTFNQIKKEPMDDQQLPRLEELEEKPNASNGTFNQIKKELMDDQQLPRLQEFEEKPNVNNGAFNQIKEEPMVVDQLSQVQESEEKPNVSNEGSMEVNGDEEKREANGDPQESHHSDSLIPHSSHMGSPNSLYEERNFSIDEYR